MISRDLRKDRNGGIEGLPLQLMIVILVATMGTAIIVGWIVSIETPHTIGDEDLQAPGLSEDGTVTGFSLEVRDQDGDYLEGAVVIIENSYVVMTDSEGAETAPVALTDENGKAGVGTEEMSLHELREEAMDLRDSVQRAYFQQAVVTHELRIPSGQSLVVGGGDGYGYLIRLCVDGQPVENLTLGSSVVLGEETVLSGHMVLKLSGCMDEDGDYGVVVT